MNRSVGVTLIAILALIGTVLALAMGVFAGLGMALALGSAETPKEFQGSPIFFKAIMVMVPFFYVLPAVWGIVTSIALLRLKNWARISIIVFAALLAVMGVFGG